MPHKTFLPTVARALLVDPDTNVVIGQGYLLSETGLSISMANAEVRGDRNNALQYLYYHTRNVELSLVNVQFEQTFLATNLGTTVANGAQNVWTRECRTLSSDTATLEQTPVGNVTVARENGTLTSVTPSGSTITVSGAGNEKVTAMYRYNATVDRITINANNAPSVVTLILLQEVVDNNNNIEYELSVNIPSFQISGNYELSMTADGVSTTQLNGMATAVEQEGCGDDVYGYIDWIPASTANVALSEIAATPSPISGAADTTHQITVHGIRGGIGDTTTATTDCTYAMSSGSDTDITVSTAGLVTIASSATTGDTGVVEISYTDGTVTLTDEINVTVT